MPSAAKFANTQDLVNIKEIRDAVIVMKNGEMRQIIMVGGINFALKSESEQNLITQSYQEFLNSLSFPLQIVIHSRKINIEKYLATLEQRHAEEKSGLLQDQITEYQEFIRGFVSDNAIMAKTFFVVVPFAPMNLPSLPTENPLANILPFLKKNSQPDPAKTKAQDEAFTEATLQLSQRVTQVIDGLTLIGLDAEILDDEAIVELFYNFYNPESVEKESVPERHG